MFGGLTSVTSKLKYSRRSDAFPLRKSTTYSARVSLGPSTSVQPRDGKKGKEAQKEAAGTNAHILIHIRVHTHTQYSPLSLQFRASMARSKDGAGG